MTHDIMEMGQHNAIVRDNALVLYFDKAETPFVARYDLDSLAQANFEVSADANGSYVLALRDYAGRSQTVGSFANKADAHQALYTILQALLAGQSDKNAVSGKTCHSRSVICSIGCFIGRFFKWLFLLIGALAVLYVVLGFIPAPKSMRNLVTDKNTAPVTTAPVTPAEEQLPVRGALDRVPEGVAVDADTLFDNAAPRQETQDQSTVTDEEESASESDAASSPELSE